MAIPLIFLPEHRQMILQARNEFWFDFPMRSYFILKNYFKYVGLLYFGTRKALIRDQKYQRYFREAKEAVDCYIVRPEPEHPVY